MIRKIAIGIFIVLVVGGGLALIKVMQIRTLMAAGAAFTTPPETVSSATVRQETWQGTLSAIGSVSAARGVTVTPDIPGTVREIAFESGSVVEEGDLLVKLDTSTEEAQLRAVEAQVNLARTELERTQVLREQNTVSQSDLDTAMARLSQITAEADTIRATIAKKTIRAPFGGRLGIRQVNLGEYLEAGKPIVSLQSLAPIYANFSLPQQALAKLSTGMNVILRTDAYPERQFEGTLSAINPDLNAATRSVALQAAFENQEQLLRPGMFAKVEVLLPQQRDVLVVPATAILSAPFGDSVYVIESNPTNKAALNVRQQFIRSGGARGDFIVVESGLKEGDQIASTGVFKLRNGMPVVINNEIRLEPTATPRPPDS